jgi:acyl-CoA thioesterase II
MASEPDETAAALAAVPKLAWLALELLDRDLFRGQNEVNDPPWPSLFGGQVAAQALYAAGSTVSDGRLPHSLHGYFLRAGEPDAPVIFQVDRDRDGRSFSARRVAAIQHGQVIFEMSASFHGTERGPEFTVPTRAPGIDPATLPRSPASDRHPAIDIRIAAGDEVSPHPADDRREDRLWVRITEPVPDSPLAHTCLLAFVSDLGTGFDTIELPGVPVAGPSLDHALWFHGDVRADQWILLDSRPVKVGNARGLYMGTAHDVTGRLVGVFTQEILIRPVTDGSEQVGEAPLPVVGEQWSGAW